MPEEPGIYPKYLVFKYPGEDWLTDPEQRAIFHHNHDPGWSMTHYHQLEEVDDFCFVLKPISDPHARVAMAAYAESCKSEKPQLSKDLYEILGDY